MGRRAGQLARSLLKKLPPEHREGPLARQLKSLEMQGDQAARGMPIPKGAATLLAAMAAAEEAVAALPLPEESAPDAAGPGEAEPAGLVGAGPLAPAQATNTAPGPAAPPMGMGPLASGASLGGGTVPLDGPSASARPDAPLGLGAPAGPASAVGRPVPLPRVVPNTGPLGTAKLAEAGGKANPTPSGPLGTAKLGEAAPGPARSGPLGTAKLSEGAPLLARSGPLSGEVGEAVNTPRPSPSRPTPSAYGTAPLGARPGASEPLRGSGPLALGKGPSATGPLPKAGGAAGAWAGSTPLGAPSRGSAPLASKEIAPVSPVAFDEAFGLGQAQVQAWSLRLQLLAMGMKAAARPGKGRAWPEAVRLARAETEAAGIPQPQAEWAVRLAQLFVESPGAARLGHAAWVAWEKAHSLHEKASQVAHARATQGDAADPLVAAFPMESYRAALYGLGRLHESVRGQSLLEAFLPAPQ